MTHAEITAAALRHIEQPGFAQTDGLFRAGMIEGFVDGATWADSVLSIEILRLCSENERLQAEVTRLRVEMQAAIADLENEAKTAAIARLKNALR